MTRSAWVQALMFLVVAALVIPFGIDYVVGPQAFGGRVRLHTHMVDARGLTPGVSVTYLGVPVGRVGRVDLDPGGGAQIELHLDQGTEVPADSLIRVGTSGAIGIQAVDILSGASGEVLADGGRLAAPESAQPASLAEVMSSAAALVETVDPDQVQTLAAEGAAAFAGTGPALAGLIDDGAEIAALLRARSPELAEISEQLTGATVRAAGRSDDFVAGTEALRDVLGDLQDSSASLTALIDRGPVAADRVSDWLGDHEDSVAGLITTVGSAMPVLGDREPALESLLVDLPFAMGRLSSIVDGDRADFALVGTQGPVCAYPGTVRRAVGDMEPRPAPLHDYCPPASNRATRGAVNAPRPDGLGMGDYRDPGVGLGPAMARDPLLLPTGIELLDSWHQLLAEMEAGR